MTHRSLSKADEQSDSRSQSLTLYAIHQKNQTISCLTFSSWSIYALSFHFRSGRKSFEPFRTVWPRVRQTIVAHKVCASELARSFSFAHPNTGLLAELVALRVAEVVVRVETRVQCGYQVEQGLSGDCITKISTFSVFITVTEAFARAVGRERSGKVKVLVS